MLNFSSLLGVAWRSLLYRFSGVVLTVVSVATTFPGLLVRLNAALQGAPAIAINNVIGSNIANIGLVLGITAICTTIEVDPSFYKFNWPALLIFSLLLYAFLLLSVYLSSSRSFVRSCVRSWCLALCCFVCTTFCRYLCLCVCVLSSVCLSI